MNTKTIRCVPIPCELPTGTPIQLPLGSEVVNAHRTEAGTLQLVVMHGVNANMPFTVAVHAVIDNSGYAPPRGRYIATVDGAPGRPVHVFVGPHRDTP